MMTHERPKTKRYASGNDPFLFSVFCRIPGKTGNTGAQKLPGRTHPMTHGVYLLYRLFKDSSTKSYGKEKPNRYSTNNTWTCPFQTSPSAEGASRRHLLDSRMDGAAAASIMRGRPGVLVGMPEQRYVSHLLLVSNPSEEIIRELSCSILSLWPLRAKCERAK